MKTQPYEHRAKPSLGISFAWPLLLILVFPVCSKAADAPDNAAPSTLAKSIADAEAKENSGDVAGALALYEAALKTAPNDPALHIHIAQAAYKLKKGERGIQAIDRLMAIDFPNRDTGALLRLKGQFEAMPRSEADPKAKAASAAAAALTGRDRLELDTISDIWREAESATDGTQQKRALTELLRRSASFVKAHPEQTTVWLMRASAAVTLDLPLEGWKAGQKLISQGALDSQDSQTRQVMSLLNRRKWLEATAPSSNRAAPGQKYENSLGMKFVPVPGTDVLFCIWETRVKDYSAYASANPNVDGSWRTAKFKEVAVSDGPTHPVVNVNWEDAQAFCAWLTKKEQEEGSLAWDQRYRLPTDIEWSAAVDLPDEIGKTPKDRSTQAKTTYPWNSRGGNGWPPPKNAGNFLGDTELETSFAGFRVSLSPHRSWNYDYHDGYATTAPVGSFISHRFGLHDMAGNVWEWCEDEFTPDEMPTSFLGVLWEIISPNKMNNMALAMTNGIVVTRVIGSSPAKASDLRPSDVLVQVGGQIISNDSNLSEIVRTISPGRTVAVVLHRGEVRLVKSVTLAAAPRSRVVRGGCWLSDNSEELLSSHRWAVPPSFPAPLIGFRCVLALSHP